MANRRPVKKLDTTIVNRIAAGEVVKRPANALKEMLENSLDAEASLIQVVVKDGGMKLLQIQDNGFGIAKDDLSVVCERFTTSKLETFDDLKSICTYGFRGEALSSISHIAHVTIVTKTDDERCGYKVSYADGKMKGIPVPCGVNRGTQITVENMFYNVPTRHRMLKNFNEEFSRIRDVVARYAIHNANVGFSLKKYGRDDVHVKTLANSTCVDNIRSIYGNVIARDLMEAKETDETLQLKFHILSTSLDYHAPQLTFLLFINHRLVDAEGLRKELDLLYGLYLPVGTHPFIYISLEMAPENVDVNSPLSVTNPLAHETSVVKNKPEVYPYEKVRIDATDQKIDRFLQPVTKSGDPSLNIIHVDEPSNLSLFKPSEKTEKVHSSVVQKGTPSLSQIAENQNKSFGNVNNGIASSSSIVGESKQKETTNSDLEINFQGDPETCREVNVSIEKSVEINGNANDNMECSTSAVSQDCDMGGVDEQILGERREFSFTSLETLRKQVVDDCDHELKRVLRSASFVGCLEYRYMLMQHSTNLYIFMVMLCEFGNFGVMKLSQPMPLSSLLKSAVEDSSHSFSEVKALSQQLIERSVMLEDYFSIKIDQNGNILSFPWLLQQYSPCVSYLPEYILKLVTEVNWNDELSCFKGVCQKTAWFYSQIPSKKDQFKNTQEWNWTLEHILFPNIKRYILNTYLTFGTDIIDFQKNYFSK
ncbi:DNA mismatch repair protein Mlh1 [Gryllus bimaculatus]|nr:DNA mismatch repair protein Mlh1 [Gryllus bimaculatus]